jgi:hypothetical protein
MDAEYYRRLAREMMAEAAAAEDPAIAARHRLIIAKALEEADRPVRQAEQQPQQKQQLPRRTTRNEP